jgi:glucosamine-6-phosphate deaminase
MTSTRPDVRVLPDPQTMATEAAKHAAELLNGKLQDQALVRVVAATGQSQIPFLERLTSDRSIAWSRIELFHLDEYIGLGPDHPASFVRYIRERIIQPAGIEHYHLLDGAKNVDGVIADANAAISERPVDISFIGIGENGHLAFNDPPADFQTETPFLRVMLDQACRQQQVNEGWFPSLETVPQFAITMSVRQILKSKQILCSVPGKRKAHAVKAALQGPVSPSVPASILNTHPNVVIFLDSDSASLLSE